MKFPMRINRILPRVLAPLGGAERLKNGRVIDEWPQIVGRKIAAHARATSADLDYLFVTVDNPVWQGQLFMMKAQILERIKAFGVTFKDIKFTIRQSNDQRKEEHEGKK